MYKAPVLLLMILLFSSCFELLPVGTNTFVKEVYNKNNAKKATLFLKGGNATSDNSLQVIVTGKEHELEEGEVGNAFTVDSDHSATHQDSNSIGFTWLSNDTLQISYDKKLRVFTQEKRVGDVSIVYEPR